MNAVTIDHEEDNIVVDSNRVHETWEAPMGCCFCDKNVLLFITKCRGKNDKKR